MYQDPRTLETIQNFLFADRKEMEEAHLQPAQIERIIRMRDVYSYWLNHPRKEERDMARYMQEAYNISQSVAYKDLRYIKILLGSLNSSTTDYYRYLFIQRCEEGFRMAREKEDPKAFASVLSALGKYTRLDRDEAQVADYSLIVPQPFEMSGDPAVAGFQPIPDLNRKIQKYLQQWQKEATAVPTAEYEEVKPLTPEDYDPLHSPH